MYVKSLKVAGFKSFADPTILEFVPAVNVLVGPNGSGKSNIADALAWVLGAQAPSSLRGASMEDVIFAGSEARPRLSYAEVELTLDNSSRVLPLDLNEVSIARFTDRAGSSEYRINGAPCRLLDITELLSDTGIGRTIHTVVGQGGLDAVLQARPEERRAFIEEAAQIGKYRRRKDRARKKIERVDDNLTRLGDVLTELRRAIRPLKRQANAAALYSELVAEQRTLKQRLAAGEVARLEGEAKRHDPDAEAHRAGLLAEELAAVRARLESAGAERSEGAAQAEAARAVAHRTARAVDRLEGLARLAEERAEKITARLAAETEEGYRERIRLLEGERNRWNAEAGSLSDGAASIRARAQSARAAADDARNARHRAERALGRTRAEETAALQALVRAEGSEAAGRAMLGSTAARVRAISERREVAATELGNDVESLAAAESDVRALETELDTATERAAAAEAAFEAARERTEELKEGLGAGRAGVAAAGARLGALDDVARLFSDRSDVLERIEPLLAEARAGAALAAEEQDEAARMVNDAHAELERRWERVAAENDELRRLDALMSGAAERLAGAGRRREKRETEIATLDDELARAQEALADAERAAAEERAALPARRAAVEEAIRVRAGAEESFRVAQTDANRRAAAATDAEMEARSAEERVLAARLRGEEAEAGIADAEAALAGLEDLRSALKDHRSRVLAVAGAARAAAERGVGWVGAAERRADEARARAEESEKRLLHLTARERELSESLEQVARRRNEAEVHRAEAGAHIEALVQRAMDEWGFGLGELRALDPPGENEAEEALERVAKLERDMRRVGPVNPTAAEEYNELAEREQFLESQIEDLKKSRRDLLKVVREVDETILAVFSTAYDAVAHEFQEVFRRLFPGGSGKLALTDPGDLLTSGVELEARPPGKNVRKLSLLSGGERSLVALAFLLAIFRARPSPFYLLDEVEAALDDINLQRFLTFVHELAENAQVLVVTHQKRTMEAADVLYGVSMAKDGVSRVVAKRLERTPAEPVGV